MKLAFQLAYRNLIGAGLRTWLNVGVLAFTYLLIIFYNGMIDGWNQEARRDGIAWEYGYGQLLNQKFDPYDPFTLQDGHGILPIEKTENLVPVLIQQATLYPQGRMISVLVKGIEPNQVVVKIPTKLLNESGAKIPAIIGKRMAASANLKEGDEVLLRWRDKNGTFDAGNITIAGIFDSQVPTIDNGQIWVSIKKLWTMTELSQEATLFIANKDYVYKQRSGWFFKSQDDLLKNLNDIISMKKVSGSFMYLLLLAIAMLAIFDTQVLSIFRRQREIGTYVSLGMTRLQVVQLFTVEGSMYSLFATFVGSIVGIPLFIYIAKTGIGLPSMEGTGVPIADKIYPVYGLGLIIGTLALVVISATIVSFLPARKISKMNPVDALKGKIQ